MHNLPPPPRPPWRDVLRYQRRFLSTLLLPPPLFHLVFRFSCCSFRFVLPRDCLAEMEETAVRSVVGQRRELCTCLPTFADFHCRVRAAHLGLRPAGMRGVHFDF